MRDMKSFWTGRRVLVTGHTGFKGAWLAHWLVRLGADVTGLALPPTRKPNLFDLLALERLVRSRFADVRELASVERVVSETRPEVVVHLAAQALVLAGYRAPLETFATNVMGTANVLDASRRGEHVRAVVIATSDKCYRNDDRRSAYVEEDPLGGNDPYSSSKACAELVSVAYRRSFLEPAGVGVATVRAGNVIGGGDWADDRLIPDIVRAIETGTKVVLRHPQATRPWQHVLEPLQGYLQLAERLFEQGNRFAQSYNFGPTETPMRVSDVVEAFYTAFGEAAAWDPALHDFAPEHSSLRLDSARARNVLEWAPRLSTGEAIEWAARWYAALRLGDSAQSLTEQQIVEYERRNGLHAKA